MDQKINDELRLDLGRQVIVHEKNTIVDCVWCLFSKHHGRSFYQEADGKDWTTHPNYQGTLKLCPNCFGKGSIESDNTTIIDKVIIDVVQELELIEGVFGKIDRGRKLLTGQLSDIKGEANFNDNILFKAIKVVIDSLDYRVLNVKPIGLLTDFIFEAEVERMDRVDLPNANVLTT